MIAWRVHHCEQLGTIFDDSKRFCNVAGLQIHIALLPAEANEKLACIVVIDAGLVFPKLHGVTCGIKHTKADTRTDQDGVIEPLVPPADARGIAATGISQISVVRRLSKVFINDPNEQNQHPPLPKGGLRGI